jgi:hypothetical protein
VAAASSPSVRAVLTELFSSWWVLQRATFDDEYCQSMTFANLSRISAVDVFPLMLQQPPLAFKTSTIAGE